MKKLYTLMLACSITICSLAQNVTITPSGITPATGGIPKMTYEEILAIPSPENGDLVIDISNNTLRMWNGTEWTYFTSGLSKDNVLLTGYAVSGDSTEYVSSIAFDNSGNRYITGIFNGSATFGSTTLYNEAGSLYTTFVAKQNANGDYLWIKTSTGSGGFLPLRIRLDNSGNIFLAGEGSGSETFWDGGGTLVSQNTDVIVAKLNPSGVPLWSRRMGGPDYDNLRAMDFDESFNIIVTGTFSGTASFVGNNLISSGGDDSYIARLSNSTGSVTLLKQIGDLGSERVFDIKLNSSGNYIISGIHTDVLTMGAFSFSSPPPGKNKFFIGVFNPVTNTYLQGKSFGNSKQSEGYLELDSNDNIYLSGVTVDSLNTGHGYIKLPTASNPLNDDEAVFILKLDPTLTVQNLAYYGGDGLSPAIMKMDENDKLFAEFRTGRYLNIGDGSYYDSNTAKTIIAEIEKDNGIMIWSDQIYGLANGLDLNVDSQGNPWITGVYGGDIRVGNTRLLGVGDYYNDVNQIDAFVIKVVK